MIVAALISTTAEHRRHIFNRVVAKILDILMVLFSAAVLPYPIGPIFGFIYSLLGDAMNFGPFHHQSIGKRLVGLQVRARPGTPGTLTLKSSLLRNAPVGVATFFAIIPVWGWLILLLIGLPLMLIEIYLMTTGEEGHRLGDIMGDTEVVEWTHQKAGS